MPDLLNKSELVNLGLAPEEARRWLTVLEDADGDPSASWQVLLANFITASTPFCVVEQTYQRLKGVWDPTRGPFPAWKPTAALLRESNLGQLMHESRMDNYSQLHRWSIEEKPKFWKFVLERLGIVLRQSYSTLLHREATNDAERWLCGASLNIVESCFRADSDSPAIVFRDWKGSDQTWTFAELSRMADRVASGLRNIGLKNGDPVAIDMPMTAESVAIYLGIVKAGMVAVSIADSFTAEEIAARLRITNAGIVFTQDSFPRAGRKIPLYEKVLAARPQRIIVVPFSETPASALREGDLNWQDFLPPESEFQAVVCHPDTATNILFSSGTTGDPKAIPWTHLTPIKAAMDGHFHQDIRPGDVVAWPTNLGWMMGPWLIYASLINRATIALYYGVPTERGFGEFVQDVGVTMLGLVPSMVKAWRRDATVENLDWSSIRVFSSTGECSNPSDYLYLMWLGNMAPVVEYCGGTEIGGGYITGSVVEPSSPATFSTPALGLDVEIFDDSQGTAQVGEMFIEPLSIGLSNRLLNQDHSEVYFEGTPTRSDGTQWRRHGDQMERLPGGYFRALGRADDTMNLNGIKVSSVELERVVSAAASVVEAAAIAVSPDRGGPSQLVVCFVPSSCDVDPVDVKQEMQALIKSQLNPLFRISQVRIIDALPRTASSKVMRRVLRATLLDDRDASSAG